MGDIPFYVVTKKLHFFNKYEVVYENSTPYNSKGTILWVKQHMPLQNCLKSRILSGETHEQGRRRHRWRAWGRTGLDVGRGHSPERMIVCASRRPTRGCPRRLLGCRRASTTVARRSGGGLKAKPRERERAWCADGLCASRKLKRCLTPLPKNVLCPTAILTAIRDKAYVRRLLV